MVANAKPNLGSTNPFPTQTTAGGLLCTNNVQLISARVDKPLPWAVTLAPVTTKRYPSVVPWAALPFDGIVGAVPPSSVGVVAIPAIESANGFKVRLEWGAGGVRGVAVFDYPSAGQVFGVTAEQLDLNVFVPNTPTTLYAADGDVPVFAAHMVPRQCDKSVRYTDVAQNAGCSNVQSVGWSVKPYARYLHVSQLVKGNRAKLYSVTFYNDAGVDPLLTTYLAQDFGSQNTSARPIPVPPQATYVVLAAVDDAEFEWFWRLTWECELA